MWKLPSIGIPLIQQIALRNHGLHVKKVRKLQKNHFLTKKGRFTTVFSV